MITLEMSHRNFRHIYTVLSFNSVHRQPRRVVLFLHSGVLSAFFFPPMEVDGRSSLHKSRIIGVIQRTASALK